MGRFPGGERAVEWRAKATSSQVDIDLIFPTRTVAGDARLRTESIKATCGCCRGGGACLAFVMETDQDSGERDAVSEEDRRRIGRYCLTPRRVMA